MAAPTIDTNQWYYLYVNNNKKSALLGTSLYSASNTRGAVFFNTTDTSANGMRWQIFPVTINSTTLYTLRCKDGGDNAFIGAQYTPAEETDGQTRPSMFRGDIADNSVFWTFGAWGDGTWWLSNAKNGSDWHINRKSSGILALDSNITAPQNGQRWGLESIAKIDDRAYSSVNLLGATATTGKTTATQTSATSSTSTSTSTSPITTTSSGLSTAAKAGIGAGVGLIALIALVVLALFWRKRKQHKPAYAPSPTYEPHDDVAVPMTKYEVYHDSAAKHELASPPSGAGNGVAEVPSHERPVELPGSPVVR